MESERLSNLEQNKDDRKARKGPKRAPPRPPKKPDMWELLKGRIQEYTEAAIAESWKGGGDPADIEVHELRLKITWLELCNHIARMKEELT